MIDIIYHEIEIVPFNYEIISHVFISMKVEGLLRVLSFILYHNSNHQSHHDTLISNMNSTFYSVQQMGLAFSGLFKFQ